MTRIVVFRMIKLIKANSSLLFLPHFFSFYKRISFYANPLYVIEKNIYILDHLEEYINLMLFIFLSEVLSIMMAIHIKWEY